MPPPASATLRIEPPVPSARAFRRSVSLNTSASSRGFGGPTLTKATSVPERRVCSPSSVASKVDENRPGSPCVRSSVRWAPWGRHRDGLGGVRHGLAFHADLAAVARGLGAQGLLLQGRLLHQPVADPPQQVEMGAAPLVAPRPEPGVVGGEQGDAALVLPREGQQRQRVRPLQDRLDAGPH